MNRTAPRLAIDGDSAAARLAGGELDGPWQLPAELARRALRSGARHVAVTVGDRGFAVRDDGPEIDEPTREWLERALSHQRPEDALARLEEGPHPELRFLAALPGARVAVTSRGGPRIEVQGIAWEPERAREWLRSVGRFAGAAIELDGRTLAAPPSNALASEPIEGPLPGELSLRATGEEAAVWVLVDRVVSAFLVVPGVLPFEAVVDLSALGPRANGAALRDAIAPEVPALLRQAARLTRDVARRVDTLPPARATRLRDLLLRSARSRDARREALRAPVYPARVGAETRWLSLVDLNAADVCGPDRRLGACAPDEVRDSLFLGPAPALILDGPERGRLSQELGLRFRRVPRADRAQPRSRPWLARLRDAFARVQRGRDEGLVRAAAAALRHDPAWAFAAELALQRRPGSPAARDTWRGRRG